MITNMNIQERKSSISVLTSKFYITWVINVHIHPTPYALPPYAKFKTIFTIIQHTFNNI